MDECGGASSCGWGTTLRPRSAAAVVVDGSSSSFLPQRLLRLRGSTVSVEVAVVVVILLLVLVLVAFKYALRTGFQPGQLRTCFHKSGYCAPNSSLSDGGASSLYQRFMATCSARTVATNSAADSLSLTDVLLLLLLLMACSDSECARRIIA